MTRFIKYFLTFVFLIAVMTIIGLEMYFGILAYLMIYAVVGFSLFYLFERFKFLGLKPNIILILTFVSTLFTYVLMAIIIPYETHIAYTKLKSIPVENLVEFHHTKNIQVIPEEKRRTWIGVRYVEIGIVSKNRSQSLNAVGWQGSSVFAYYDIDEKEYNGSYH